MSSNPKAVKAAKAAKATTAKVANPTTAKAAKAKAATGNATAPVNLSELVGSPGLVSAPGAEDSSVMETADVGSTIERTLYFADTSSATPDTNLIDTYLGTGMSVCSKKAGTPQARLVSLLKGSKNVINKYRPDITNFDIGSTKYKLFRSGDDFFISLKEGRPANAFGDTTLNGLLAFMEGTTTDDTSVSEEEGDSSRGWWGESKNKDKVNFLNIFIEGFITSFLPLFVQDPKTENEIIVSLGMEIWDKSISDASQWRGLLMNVNRLEMPLKLKYTLPTTANLGQTVIHKIRTQLPIAFFTSDFLAGASAGLVTDKLEGLFLICSPRKGPRLTTDVISLKKKYLALGVLLSFISDESIIDYYYNNITAAEDPEYKIYEAIQRLIFSFIGYTNKLVTRLVPRKRNITVDSNGILSISRTRLIETELDILFNIKKSITRDSDILNLQQFIDFANFIGEVGGQYSSIELLLEKIIETEVEVDIPWWCYYVVTDVVRFMRQEEITFQDIKNISEGVLRAGVLDSKGHDYKGVTAVLAISDKTIGFCDLFQDLTRCKTLNDDHSLIEAILGITKIGTCQLIKDDMVRVIFKDSQNLLTNPLLPIYLIKDMLTSIFSSEKAVLAIDFMIKGGAPRIQGSPVHLAREVEMANPKIVPTDTNMLIRKFQDGYATKLDARAFDGPDTEYDGAANSGSAVVFAQTTDGFFVPSVCEIDFKINIDNATSSTYKLSFTTTSKEPIVDIESKFAEKMITVPKTPIDDIFYMLLEGYNGNKTEYEEAIKILNDGSENSNRFNILWSEILNYRSKGGLSTKVTLGKDELKKLLDGMKKFIGAKKKEARDTRTTISQEYLKIDELFTGINSSASVEVMKDCFYSIMVFIIKQLVSSDVTEDIKTSLLNLFDASISSVITDRGRRDSAAGPFAASATLRPFAASSTKTPQETEREDKIKSLGLMYTQIPTIDTYKENPFMEKSIGYLPQDAISGRADTIGAPERYKAYGESYKRPRITSRNIKQDIEDNNVNIDNISELGYETGSEIQTQLDRDWLPPSSAYGYPSQVGMEYDNNSDFSIEGERTPSKSDNTKMEMPIDSGGSIKRKYKKKNTIRQIKNKIHKTKKYKKIYKNTRRRKH